MSTDVRKRSVASFAAETSTLPEKARSQLWVTHPKQRAKRKGTPRRHRQPRGIRAPAKDSFRCRLCSAQKISDSVKRGEACKAR